MAAAINTVGVVGLGQMGSAFAQNLIDDGYEVLVFQRNVDHAREKLGSRAVPAVADLEGCDAVVTSLPDDDALAEAALGDYGLTTVLAEGVVHISTSTVSPAVARRVAQAHHQADQGYVAAPVLGNPAFARDRQLFLLVAGEAFEVAKVQPVLDRLGQRAFDLGTIPVRPT